MSNVVLAAVRNNGLALQYASKRLRGNREVVEAALRAHGLAIEHVVGRFKRDMSIMSMALDTELEKLPKADKLRIMSKYVAKTPCMLLDVVPALFNDSDIVTAAFCWDRQATAELAKRCPQRYRKIAQSCVRELHGSTDTGHILRRPSGNAIKLEPNKNTNQSSTSMGACTKIEILDHADIFDAGVIDLHDVDSEDEVEIVHAFLATASEVGHPAVHLVHIIGMHGSGKTTVIKNVLARLRSIESNLIFRKATRVGMTYSKSGSVLILGSWQGHPMDGTDKVSSVGAHDAKHLVEAAQRLGARVVLCEGPRLMTEPFFHMVHQATVPMLLKLGTAFSDARSCYAQREKTMREEGLASRNRKLFSDSDLLQQQRRIDAWARAKKYDEVSRDEAIDRILNLLTVKQEAADH